MPDKDIRDRHVQRATYHIEQATRFLDAYGREHTNTRKLLIEHHIHLASFHVTRAKEIE